MTQSETSGLWLNSHCDDNNVAYTIRQSAREWNSWEAPATMTRSLLTTMRRSSTYERATLRCTTLPHSIKWKWNAAAVISSSITANPVAKHLRVASSQRTSQHCTSRQWRSNPLSRTITRTIAKCQRGKSTLKSCKYIYKMSRFVFYIFV